MLRTGTAGWSIPKMATEAFAGGGSHLERYANVLPCAEINSSFYRPPMPATWRRWAESVPEDFRFSVKAPKSVTHEAKLEGPRELLEAFFAGVAELGPKLGPVLFQLPPKLSYDSHIARAFFEQVRELTAGPVVLEPRHASWFAPKVAEMLREFRIARVAADPARVPEAAVPGGWAELVYYRLHGSPRVYYTPYSGEFLAALASRLRALPAATEAWVLFDNTASGAAILNALDLMTLCHDEPASARR